MADITPDRLREIIRALLASSFRDINFEYDGLTDGPGNEKETCTREEFTALVEWIRGERTLP